MSKKNQSQELEQIPIGDLIPYAKNSRTHSDEQVAQIAGSIREFGFTNPVLIDASGTIIAGHGRVLAARKLSMPAVPCLRLGHLTPAQVRAYVIADNRMALSAGWDEEMLRAEIAGLQADGFDVGQIGFSDEEIATLLAPPANEGQTDPDDVPEQPENPVTELGYVWILGAHRITCGDSTEAHVVDRVLAGATPHLMVTDPPYGVEYDASWRNKATRSDGSPIGGQVVGKVLNDEKADWSEAWALFPGEVAYVWHAPGPLQVSVFNSLKDAGFEPRQHIIWAKSNFAIGRGHYHYQHESCWYAVKKGGTGHWAGDRKQTTLWEIPKPQKSETGHSTQKPVECMRKPIKNNSNKGDHVYEPFSGSGTTIIACEQTGRRCLAIELSPSYVDVAVKRWQAFTGKQATLESTGETFDAVAAKRVK